MSTKFSWLHLTDFHAGIPRQPHLWPTFRNVFYEDLRNLHDRTDGWDAIFFTGDLTQRGTEPEFKTFDSELQLLLQHIQALGSNPLVIAVPGNHDLQRPTKRLPAHYVLENWNNIPSAEQEFWSPHCPEYRTAACGLFDPYQDWWRQHSNPLLAHSYIPGDLPGDYSVIITKSDRKIGIIALNSSYLHLSGARKGDLAIDLRQLTAACGGDISAWKTKCDIAFILTHHPPDWLNPISRDVFRGEIDVPGRFVAHLCGHMHQDVSSTIAVGGFSPRRIWQAPSLFGLEKIESTGGTNRAHGYTSGIIRFSDEKISLQRWPRLGTKTDAGHIGIGANPGMNTLHDGAMPIEIISINPTASAPHDEFSSELRKFYGTLFDSLEFVPPELLERRPFLELENRFIEPDICPYRPGQSLQGDDKDHEDGSVSAIPTAPLQRIGVFRWIRNNTRTLITAPSGLGKTTLLRYLALTALSGEGTTGLWNGRTPITVSISTWASQSPDSAFPNFIKKWAYTVGLKVSIADTLQTKIDEGDVVLLVDGLDDGNNSELHSVLLRQVMQYADSRDIPAIIVCRPNSQGRDKRRPYRWPIAEILPLSSTCQRQLTIKWLSHLAAPRSPAIDRHAEKATCALFLAISKIPGLTELASIPLILVGIISLFHAKRSLPVSRHDALDKILDLLLTETRDYGDSSYDAGTIREILGQIAYDAHLNGVTLITQSQLTESLDAYTSQENALVLRGTGNTDNARAMFHAFITMNNGIVDPNYRPGSYRFSHEVFKEHLAGLHLAEWAEGPLFEFVISHACSGWWQPAIVSSFHFMVSKSKKSSILRKLFTGNFTGRRSIAVTELLAEVTFGQSGFAGDLALEIAENVVSQIHIHGGKKHRKFLLSTIARGPSSSRMRDFRVAQIKKWYPGHKDAYAYCPYQTLATWAPSERVRHALVRGLSSGPAASRSGAARSLVHLYTKCDFVKAEVFELMRGFRERETVIAALEAWVSAWPSDSRTSEVIAFSGRCDDPSTRLLSTIAKIRYDGSHGTRDLQDVLAIAREQIFGSWLVQRTLIEGWPEDSIVKKIAIDSLDFPSFGSGLAPSVAATVLGARNEGDHEISDAFCRLLERPTSLVKMQLLQGYDAPLVLQVLRHSTHSESLQAQLWHWITGPTGFGKGLATCTAAGEIGGTKGKEFLLDELAQGGALAHGAFAVLLRHWADDDDVLVALRTFAYSDSPYTYHAAHLFTDVLDQDAALSRLRQMLGKKDTPRRMIVSALSSILGPKETAELVFTTFGDNREALAASASLGVLIEACSEDSRVKALALKELERSDGLWSVVGRVYSEDEFVRNWVFRSCDTLALEERRQLLTQVSEHAVHSPQAGELCAKWHLDSDPIAMTLGALSVANAGNCQGDGLPRATIEALSAGLQEDAGLMTAVSSGLWQASAAALLRINETGVLLENLRPDQTLGISWLVDENWPYVREVLENWRSLRDKLRSNFWKVLFGSKEDDVYPNLIPVISEYPDVTQDMLTHYRGTGPEERWPHAVTTYFLEQAELRQEGRERFLAFLRNGGGSGMYDLLLWKSFATVYGGDEESLDAIRSYVRSNDDVEGSLVGLAVGWPEQTDLAEDISSKCPRGRTLAPDIYYLSTWGTQEQFLQCLSWISEAHYSGGSTYLTICAAPLILRLQRDPQCAAALELLMMKENADVALLANGPTLLSAADRLSPTARKWCAHRVDDLFGSFAFVGFDMRSGEYRAVWEILDDVIS